MDDLMTEKRTILQSAINDELKYNNILKTHQELNDKLCAEIKERKIKKFNKDKKDKADGTVYHWRIDEPQDQPSHSTVPKRTDGKPSRGPPMHSDQLSTSSASSNSSNFLFRTNNQRGRGGSGRNGGPGGGKKRGGYYRNPIQTRSHSQNPRD